MKPKTETKHTPGQKCEVHNSYSCGPCTVTRRSESDLLVAAKEMDEVFRGRLGFAIGGARGQEAIIALRAAIAKAESR